MPAISQKSAAVIRLARKGPIRARDLAPLGIPRVYLGRLVERGLLTQLGAGLYQHPNAPQTELHSVAETIKRVPHATACLVTALQIHGLTTELPHAVWILIETHARAPVWTTTKLEVIRASGAALTHGVEDRTIEGVRAKLTTPAKTVADCFRYRRHVGLDVALAALREYLSRGRDPKRGRTGDFSVDALLRAAKSDRIGSVIRPYLEALS